MFRDTILLTFNQYIYNIKDSLRRDYIIVEKYNLNDQPNFIENNIFKQELEYTIFIMKGNIKINAITKLINSLKELDITENKISDIKIGENIIEDAEFKNISESDIFELE